ncbi:MAG: hypothetical protein TECD_00385 [Hyphomicrobiaceae bacterium hypho_1]
MNKHLMTASACMVLTLTCLVFASTLFAQQPSSGGHRASKYYEDSDTAAKARASRQRRGGYSYSARDTINTYGDSRTVNGGANSYRFEFYTRQTPSGPFDHGFFFDSGIGMNGGNSPYNN